MQSPSDDRRSDDVDADGVDFEDERRSRDAAADRRLRVDDGASPTDTGQQPRELPPLEPESPSLENAFFVLLGVVGTLVVFLSML